MPATIADELAAPAADPRPASPLVQRALDILHGRILPPPLPVPDFVEPDLQRLLGDKVPPPTERALNQIREDWTLQHLHGGDVIVTTRVNGYVVVLAAGEDQVREVMRGLPYPEKSLVMMDHPPGGLLWNRA